MLTPILTAGGITKDSKSVILRDATGNYDADSKPGGYGTPNADQPTIIGIRWRYWSDTALLANKVISDSEIINNLLSTGGALFSSDTLGLDEDLEFDSGVHHVKYYPFETTTCVISLTQDSKVVTVTAGTLPSAFDTKYKAVLLLDGSDVIKSKVILIDWDQALTDTTFYLQDAWTGADVTGYKLMLATEADLKILFTQLAEKCIVSKIGALSLYQDCPRELIDQYTDLITWKLSAEVKFTCADYQGAHDMIVSIEQFCEECSEPCSTCG